MENVVLAAGGPFVWGQTFTAGLSGSLDTVALDLQSVEITPSSVTVEIDATDASGLPASLLTSTTATVTNTAVPTGPAQYTVVPFPTPATVTAGQVYAIVLSNAQPGQSSVNWFLNYPSTYTRGQFVRKTFGPYTGFGMVYSSEFETFVTPPATPSPSPTASAAPMMSGAPIVGALTVTTTGCGTTNPGGQILTNGLQSVVVTAVPCPGSRFTGWTGGPCNGTTINPCDFPPMFTPVTANFAP